MALIFVTNPFSLLGQMTKLFSWLSHTRWTIAIILPTAFFFSGKVLWLAIISILSLVVLIFCAISNKDRKGLPGLLIFISEISAFLWILSSFFLALDSEQDFDFFGSFLTKLFIWIQYIFWVINHILEFLIAVFCFLPPAEVETESKSRSTGRGKIPMSGTPSTNTKKTDIEDTTKQIEDQEKVDVKKIEDTA